MHEATKKIAPKDIPQIQNLLGKIFPDRNYRAIERLGGMTNRSYKVTRYDGKEYLVRIPGEGTETLINRSNEQKSAELACKLGIDAKLLYFGADGTKIMDFIPNPQPLSEQILRKRENMLQVAHIFRKLHTCGENTGVPFEIFEMAQLYEQIVHEHTVPLYEDYQKVKQLVADIKSSVDSAGVASKVPCHNDPLIDNWVIREDGTLFLIDWEYSGMNDAMWDLSCFSIEANYSTENDHELLSLYYGRSATVNEQKNSSPQKCMWIICGPYGG